MTEAIYTEEFVSLTPAQQAVLSGGEEEDIVVEVHKTPLWQEPDAEEVEPASSKRKKKKKSESIIKVVEHGIDLLPASSKNMKRPPMSKEEEIREMNKQRKAKGLQPLLVAGDLLEDDEEEEEEEDEVIEAPAQRAPLVMNKIIAPVKRKANTLVRMTGPFGSINIKYLDVYTEGMYLILVEDEDAEFSYSPPKSDDILEVQVGKTHYSAISAGISFNMPEQKVKTTILLITKE